MTLPEATLNAVTRGRNGFIYNSEGNFMGAGGAEAMDLFTLHCVRSWLELEIKTGMRMTAKASTLVKANQMLGTNYKRKQQALNHITSLLASAGELQIGE